MALTSTQKHYIKKNIDRFTVDEIALHLDLPSGVIMKYIKNRWGDRKFDRLVKNKKITNIFSFKPLILEMENFSVKNFILENINAFIFLFILILVSYLNALNNGFTSDDVGIILRNPDTGSFKSVSSAPFIGSLRPLLYLLAYKIGGLNPMYYRFINIFFHLGTTFLIFIIASLLSRKSAGFIAAAIFAVHPILVESVTWISGGVYAQGSFFFALAFLCYILGEKRKFLNYVSFVSFVLSFVSFRIAATFFMVLIIYELSFGNLKRNWKRILPSFTAGLVLIAMYLSNIGERISSLEATNYQQITKTDNPLIQVPIAVISYIKLLVWPDKLTLYQTELTFTTGEFIFYEFLFLLFLGLIFYYWKKNKPVFFWLAFFVVTLSPTLTPLKVSWIVAERYCYWASLGIIVTFAIFYDWIIQKNGKKYKPFFYSVLVIIVGALSLRTIVRNMDWKSEDTLWFATAKVAPSGQSIHNNLGDVYARNGNYEKAIEEFKKSIEINPMYASAYHNLANTYQMTGQAKEALSNYKKALEIDPNIWQSHQNIAAIYYEMGDIEKAKEHLKKALEINPHEKSLIDNINLIETGTQLNSQN